LSVRSVGPVRIVQIEEKLLIESRVWIRARERKVFEARVCDRRKDLAFQHESMVFVSLFRWFGTMGSRDLED
jgi:hypothetical protein